MIKIVNVADGESGVSAVSCKTPLELYSLLRKRLFDPQAESSGAPSLRSLFLSPFAQKFQLSKALGYLANIKTSNIPLIPIQYPSGAAPLADWMADAEDLYPKIAENCELALLWALIAKRENNQIFQGAAEKLAAFLEPILSSELVSLWSKESNFSLEDASTAKDLLLRSIGKLEFIEKPKDPFYAWIFDQNLKIELKERTLEDPSLGYRIFSSASNALAISASGKRTGAGALKIGSWKIPSFGPQGEPLSDLNLFGLNSAGNKEGWFSSEAQPEAWFRIIAEKLENGWELHVDSVGLSAHRPLAFAFYAQGNLCSIPGRSFKPASLQHYTGEGLGCVIESEGQKYSIQVQDPMKLEIIPLAGGDGFWGASFLIAFWLSPFYGSYHFKIKSIG